MVPGAGIEPAWRVKLRGILSPLRLPVSPPGHFNNDNNLKNYFYFGGWGRNRTGVRGFAGRCMTTLPPSRKI